MAVALVATVVILLAFRRTRRILLWSAGAIAVAWFLIWDHKVGQLLGIAALAIVALWITVLVHPRVAHGACGGRGRYYNKIFRWHFRLCAGCGGNGRTITRWVNVLGTERTKRLRAADLEAAKLARQRGWFAERL